MNAHVIHPQSERGVALIIVLLMLAVLSGLATGFSMNGQTEAAMAANEVYYAGARAAAEAGLARAVETITKNTLVGATCSPTAIARCNLLAGPDQLLTANLADAVNADNGQTAYLFGGAAGPYFIGAGNQYSYTIDILDDDDPQLYPLGLTADHLNAMGAGYPQPENGNPWVNTNERLILRATGFGPKNTSIRIMREIFSNDAVTPPSVQQLLANPAILVDGDLTISGNPTVTSDPITLRMGNVHSNGNLVLSGKSVSITGDATATGSFSANSGWTAGDEFGGGRAAITIPDIRAENYISLADYILHSDGTMTTPGGAPCGAVCADWSSTEVGGVRTYTISGNSAPAATFYIEGKVEISGSPGSKATPLALSLIAEGSIKISGNPNLKPENGDRIQFVTNGDLTMSGNTDLDPANVDGQIMVREQLKISGNPEFQGRVMVANEPSVWADETINEISGNPTVTYNGSLGNIVTELVIPGTTTYTNNVRGWMEQ